MPTSQFHFVGQWDAVPQSGGLLASGAISSRAPINEYVTLDAKQDAEYDLVSDAPHVVAFGGVTNANIVIIFTDRPITVTLTSSAGATQVIAIDDMVTIISRTVAYTAISITRTPATEAHVTVFLGEKA